MSKTKLILIGGFLGAGKTTLIAQMLERLSARGHRVGVITNDQAADLVDTGLLRTVSPQIAEVSAGCFCCHFDKFVESADELIAANQPDVLIGEPVGSCTDLSATVIQPIKKLYPERFETGPFSVLVDPIRLAETLGSAPGRRFPESVYYIYRKQLEEADVVVLNKIDRLGEGGRQEARRLIDQLAPGATTFELSATTGEGVDSWLDHVLSGQTSGGRIAEVDYDTYAEGEAVLGWLNAMVHLQARTPTDWVGFCQALMSKFKQACLKETAEIAHVKLHLMPADSDAPPQSITCNLTTVDGEPTVRGQLSGTSTAASLILNARVHCDPETLRRLVESAVERACGDLIEASTATVRHFSPARPVPQHRYSEIT